MSSENTLRSIAFFNDKTEARGSDSWLEESNIPIDMKVEFFAKSTTTINFSQQKLRLKQAELIHMSMLTNIKHSL